MRLSRIRTFAAAATAALGVSLGFGQADVICGALTGNTSGGPGPQHFGSDGDIIAYSIGTTSCNVGTVPLNWFATGSNRHPLIITNIYRIDDGAIEQIAVSWVKHGFCALQETLCGSCTATCGGCCSTLGVGCSDPYTAGLNATQTGLGPRNEINAATGEYPWPFATQGQSGNAIFKRLQVHVDDINPLLNPNAAYVGEAQYIAKDDADAGNAFNNASHRMITVGSENPFGGGWFLNYQGPTIQTEPAIFAWQDLNPGVELTAVDVPGDGRFWVGAHAIDNGDGTWRYEYAVFNYNSDRAAGAFQIDGLFDLVSGTAGFRDVEYHSGEPYDETDWVFIQDSMTPGAEMVRWESSTDFNTNPNGNAVRWGTLYNYRFTSTAAPATANASIALYEPGGAGEPAQVDFEILAPQAATGGGCNVADIAEPFDVLDLADLQSFIAAFVGGQPAADIAAPFGVLDLADVQLFIAQFTAGCP